MPIDRSHYEAVEASPPQSSIPLGIQQDWDASPSIAMRHHDEIDESEEAELEDEMMDIPHEASLAMKKRLWWRNALLTALWILSWYFFATLLSVYNKWMFSPERFGFPYPFFVTSMHFWIQTIIASILRFSFPSRFRPSNSPDLRAYSTRVAPTAVATALDIGSSNLSLQLITLSFYTMVKSSSLIFVLFFAFLFKLEPFSLRLVAVITLISTGVLLMVFTETAFVLLGFLLVLAGSAFGGLRWALTTLLLRDQNLGMDNPVVTLFWLAPAMGATLSFLSIVVEGWGNVFATKFFHDGAEIAKTIPLLILPGTLAFAMVLSEFFIISRAGVVPMSIAGIFKEVTTLTVAAWVFGDSLTPLNIIGVIITFLGIILYTYHKYQKSLESSVPLDAHGNPIPTSSFDRGVRLDEDAMPLKGRSNGHTGHRTDLVEEDVEERLQS
ncbi:TPT-domain-containing protein [Sistotremastrum suecicum HHB10207 ss-3]|uniref:TPT-domain-containing protein n=1 Tax=Sistotremastrum suecicum HHB10207 ss-3 TaxID=1314776 RepID=A0A165ZBW1_9AGAM|nr:TPT-domain-containing protein [Sistotremastrum suecicum HHB10207 ss-3]